MSAIRSPARFGASSLKRLVLLAVLVAGLVGWWIWSQRKELGHSAPDPRLTYASRFRNVRPEVEFVGDDACSKCHPAHAARYREHPMGRSLTTVAPASPLEKYDDPAQCSFAASGFQYNIERQNERIWHTEKRLRPDGQVVAAAQKEIQFVMGAGEQGRSYIIEKDGFLWQSPITWYHRTGQWGPSPGYAASPLNFHFERKIEWKCLFCHVNRAEPVVNTLNRYEPPVFRGQAIGCERCHGPGALHVQFRANHGEASTVDETIVNPRHLDPALREAVCQQCHMEAEEMILRRGRQPFDYRPGLPLQLFWSLFMRADNKENNKFISQVDQMYASRCFQASNGRMGCTSCHDPHEFPKVEEKTAYYRRQCLNCHAQQGCSLPLPERQARSKADDCVQCHMPQRDSEDIMHTWHSDHRVPRLHSAEPTPTPMAPPRRGESPLVRFHQETSTRAEQAEVQRDLGIAMANLVRRTNWSHPQAARYASEYASQAMSLLNAALNTWPDDLPARESKALVLRALSKPQEALTELEEVIAAAPTREFALATAGTMALELGDRDKARDYLQRAIAVDPWDPDYHADLARCLALQRDWPAAIAASQRAVAISPFHVNARKVLVGAYLQAGERAKAAAELETLIGLNPADEQTLRRKFGEQVR